MMAIEIDIKAEDINEYLKNAVIESRLGETVVEQIKEKLKDYSLKNAIQKQVDAVISKHIYDLLTTGDNKEAIRLAVSTALAEVAVEKVAAKAFERFLDNM